MVPIWEIVAKKKDTVVEKEREESLVDLWLRNEEDQ